MRQGPHQGAQKSTRTGLSASSTSAWKLLSVTSSRLPATAAPCRVSGRFRKYSVRHRNLSAGTFQTASSAIRAVILECPSRRSRNRIGTSVDAEAGLHGPVGQLDLEAVAVGVHARQVDPLEHAPVEALEAAGQVAHRHAEQHPRVPGAAAREQPPQRRPSPPRRRPARSASRARGRPRPAAAIRRGRSAGSCEKSASISRTSSAPSASAISKPAR